MAGDLLDAGDAGGLAALLGAELGVATLDEMPLRLTRAQLSSRMPGLSAATLERAGGGPHPARWGTACPGPQSRLARLGGPLHRRRPAADGALDLIGALRAGLAEAVTDHVIDHVLEPLRSQGRADAFAPVLRRGQLLLLQGLASMFADQLGEALLARAETDPLRGDILRAAIEEIRVGAVADAAGTSSTGAAREDRQPAG